MRTLHDKNSKPPRLPKILQKERQMLDKLSRPQIELAFNYLTKPLKESPPDELSKLNEMEWFLLSRMLDSLLSEKMNSPLQ
jgi:hypothetical protein